MYQYFILLHRYYISYLFIVFIFLSFSTLGLSSILESSSSSFLVFRSSSFFASSFWLLFFNFLFIWSLWATYRWVIEQHWSPVRDISIITRYSLQLPSYTIYFLLCKDQTWEFYLWVPQAQIWAAFGSSKARNFATPL